MDNQLPQTNIPEPASTDAKTLTSKPELSKKERRELKRQERRAVQMSEKRGSTMRRVLIWVIALLAVGGSAAGVYYLAITSTPDETNKNGTLIDTVSSADWIRGNSASPVMLVEYGDFQCPACAQYYPVVKALEQEFAADTQFIFRHFPLTRPHPNAKGAAAAAEAAGIQGKFWEMHDILFERQNEWAAKPRPQSTFNSYAEELGLDVKKFEDDMDRDD
ncbi:MAG: thioredoxin domain-containing protein, partial [Patescibacteria group bacterium]